MSGLSSHYVAKVRDLREGRLITVASAVTAKGYSRTLLYDLMRQRKLNYVEHPQGRGRLIYQKELDALPDLRREGFANIQEAVKLSDLKRSTIYQRMKDGELTFIVVRHRRLISVQALKELAAGSQRKCRTVSDAENDFTMPPLPAG